MTCHYNGVYPGDASLEPVWAELERLGATVFAPPDACGPASMGRPSPLLEVAFETARTIIDMLYAGAFRRYPNIRLIVAHCGGALPALSGRLHLLCTEASRASSMGLRGGIMSTLVPSLSRSVPAATAASAGSGARPPSVEVSDGRIESSPSSLDSSTVCPQPRAGRGLVLEGTQPDAKTGAHTATA